MMIHLEKEKGTGSYSPKLNQQQALAKFVPSVQFRATELHKKKKWILFYVLKFRKLKGTIGIHKHENKNWARY